MKDPLEVLEAEISLQQDIIESYLIRCADKLYSKRFCGRQVGFVPTAHLQSLQKRLQELENKRENLISTNRYSQLPLL
jgi:hypothetical protein